MGNYLNPGNESFKKAINSHIYVDKTGLIKEVNYTVNDEKNCIALSHARRFGKSQAAGMLDAYYSCGYDSRKLFENFAIAKEPEWDRYLNKFNVIHLEMATLVNNYGIDLVPALKRLIYVELAEQCPEIIGIEHSIAAILNDAYIKTGVKFVIIIDEWDCVVRNYVDNHDFVHQYMQFLHDIFKSRETSSFLALGYITGIMPIKKIKDESALNNFREYTMLDSGTIARYFGFTDDEVRNLCDEFSMDYAAVSKWYNGYLINGLHIYNPNSVYMAMIDGACKSYWKNTASFETINTFIMLNMDGLKEAVIDMLSGGRADVEVSNFKNDLSIIRNRNDALTALIHLGYLGYDASLEEAFVPNYEVATAYKSALSDGSWAEIAKSIDNANITLKAMIAGRAAEVAEYINEAHEAYTSLKNYNNENALYSVLYMALFTARAYYDVERELAAGKGYADMVLIPRREAGNRPAMVIELKWNKSADTAIKQIKEKRYAGKLKDYNGRVLLVGINYTKRSKKHTCKIEEA